MSEDHRAWAVIARMHAELQRQSIAGGVRRYVPVPDTMGRVEIVGVVDLAALAAVTGEAMAELYADAS